MKLYILLIASTIWFIFLSWLFVSDRMNELEIQIAQTKSARLEYENKLLELENMVFVDFHVAGYEPFICEDKRCWIKKEL